MKRDEGESTSSLTAGLKLAVWRIEILQSGAWEIEDTAHSEEDALALASAWSDYVPEDRIRIRTPTGQTL